MDEQGTLSRSRRAFLRDGAAVGSILTVGAGPAGALSDQEERSTGEIQRQIDEADSGDTVVVEPGEYTEGVVVDKPLTLRGADRTTVDRPTIDSRGREYGIVIEADDVTIEGFEVVGDDATAAGITVYTEASDLTGVTIDRNYLTGMAGATGEEGRQAFGVLSYGKNEVSDLTVSNNVVEKLGGDNDEDPQGVGINLQSIDGDEPGAGGLVVGNEVRAMADGDLGVSFGSPADFDRAVPPFGVALTVQPLDGDVSEAGSCGVIVRRNVFEDNSVDAVFGNRSDPMTSELIGNNFGGGDDFGAVNVGEPITARCNYWGHSSGPSHSGNLSGRGDIVLGKVEYRPWSEEPLDLEGDVAIETDAGGTEGTEEAGGLDATGNDTGDATGNDTGDAAGNDTGDTVGNSTGDAELGGPSETPWDEEISCSGGETTGDGG